MATHTMGSSGRYKPDVDIQLASHFSLPDTISTDKYFQKEFQNKMGIKARVVSKMETLFLKFFRA